MGLGGQHVPWQQDWLYWGKLGWGPEWDPDTYPDPADMVKQLKDMNLKLVQIGLWAAGPHVNSWASKMSNSCCFGRCAEPILLWFSYTMLHLFGANWSFLQTGSGLPKLTPIGSIGIREHLPRKLWLLDWSLRHIGNLPLQWLPTTRARKLMVSVWGRMDNQTALFKALKPVPFWQWSHFSFLLLQVSRVCSNVL